MNSTIKIILRRAVEKIGNNQHERWSRHGMYQPPRKISVQRRMKRKRENNDKKNN